MKIPLSQKILLTIPEAYAYTGMSRAEIFSRINRTDAGRFLIFHDGKRVKLFRESIDAVLTQELKTAQKAS